MKRVVITGIGMITSLGKNKDETWDAIMNGKCGVGPITKFDTTDFPCKIAAEIKDFSADKYIQKKEQKKLALASQYGIFASLMALEDANLNITPEIAEDVGIILSTGVGGLEIYQIQNEVLRSKGPKKVSPFLVPGIILNMTSGNVAIYTGAKGPNKTIVTACASGTHSIGDSFEIIRSDRAKVMIAGGTEASIVDIGVAGFAAMKALSTNFNDNPKKASRPFSKDRDGFVMGEGSGVLILEELEFAKKRGAKIYAEVVGYGETADAHHITSPHPEGDGAARAISGALKEANIDPKNVDYLNAHGTSTIIGDLVETKVIKKIFKEYASKLNVSSTKGATGHCLGAAGGIEGAILALSIFKDMIPPTINYDNPDPECDLNYVPNKPLKTKVDVGLSLSLGFGGQNAAIVLKKFKN